MNDITYKEKHYPMEGDESVLTCFLRHGLDYPHACQAGICQSCLIKSKDEAIDPAWQVGLSDTLKSKGYFLACLAKPKTDLTVEPPESAECEVEGRIIGSKLLNHNVLQLKIAVENFEPWIPGSYVHLINPEGTIRSYSIANLPLQDQFIELQIKLQREGAMSQWLQHHHVTGAEVKLRGPFGQCYYYNPEHLSYPILLAGTGTGLAPLLGIARSALTQGHQGSITLVHGGLNEEDIYCNEELEALKHNFKDFHYDPCVLNSKGKYPQASIEQRVLTHLNEPNQTRVFVCGPKEIVNKLKTNLFLGGVPSRYILSDPFI